LKELKKSILNPDVHETNFMNISKSTQLRANAGELYGF